MEYETMRAAIEAQLLMRHCGPSPHLSSDGARIVDYSWDVDHVRQALHVPLDALWDERVLELEMQGLASFCLHSPPVTWDDDGTEHEIPSWRDEPREEWGTLSLYARGVLRLAELYGRPYVRVSESPALIAHWHLVEAESAARHSAPYDPEKRAREWPEREILWQAWLAEHKRRWDDDAGAGN